MFMKYFIYKWFYVYEIEEMITKIEIERKAKRLNGETMNTTFCNDLRDLLNTK